jgi:hypothetical protein
MLKRSKSSAVSRGEQSEVVSASSGGSSPQSKQKRYGRGSQTIKKQQIASVDATKAAQNEVASQFNTLNNATQSQTHRIHSFVSSIVSSHGAFVRSSSDLDASAAHLPTSAGIGSTAGIDHLSSNVAHGQEYTEARTAALLCLLSLIRN